tara:strand:- start:67003 stop:67533 length:531 start_codon:yes stop_codon:yes gene_type:complete
MDESYQKMLHGRLDARGPDIAAPAPIKVNTLKDLYTVIRDIQPVSVKDSTKIVHMENIEDPKGNKYKSFPVKITDDGQPMARKLLVDGFELLKRQQEFNDGAGVYEEDIEEYGGFLPAATPNDEVGASWVTSFVSKHLDGKIDGLSVIWEIPEGKFRLNPWTGALTKVVKGAPGTT